MLNLHAILLFGDVMPLILRIKSKSNLFLSVYLKLIVAVAILIGAQDGIALAADSLPNLYFKPPYHKLADGTKNIDPVTIEQITTDFYASIPSSATEVQLLFYWSQICPNNPNDCNFAIVDQAIKFWQDHKKKIILSFQTISYPTKIMAGSTSTFARATPSWVMENVQTYSYRTKAIGQMQPGSSSAPPDMDYSFPVNWDSNFVRLVNAFVDKIASRYDGNPTIASIVIALGLNGEDLTFPGTPNLNASNWVLSYEKPIVDHYIASFHKTKLEFDMALLGFLRKKSNEMHDRASVDILDKFVAYLISHSFIVSVEGLNQATSVELQNLKVDSASSLNYLLQAQRGGCEISMEALQPLSGPRMNDLPAIEAAIKIARPSRIGLFNPSVNDSLEKTRRLLSDLGYRQ